MLKKNPFIRGTLLLTLTGVLTRIIGFFYRIFLSRTIGEEGMGIYQLTAPVMALSFSLTCSGIQTAISKYVAAYHAKQEEKKSLLSLFAGFCISMLLSVLTAFVLYRHSIWISARLLLEPRCAPLVRIFALSIPFSSLHCCINGYYYGLKKTALPSAAQLIEQLVRVGTVFLLYKAGIRRESQLNVVVSMIGILAGEIVSSLISIAAITLRVKRLPCCALKQPYSAPDSHMPISVPAKSATPFSKPLLTFSRAGFLRYPTEILRMAIPLSANRLVLNTLQSIEAVQIPTRLMAHGMSNTQSLEAYGVLTGMALPMILFPTALTSSVSVLLLPYISEAQAHNNQGRIRGAIRKCSVFCILMGSVCCIFFLSAGPFLGHVLFTSRLAGTYIQLLSMICPFFYLSGVLMSVLHGLGKAFTAFLLGTLGLMIRLGFVFFLIPLIGMAGYMIGLFVSQLILMLLLFLVLKSIA